MRFVSDFPSLRRKRSAGDIPNSETHAKLLRNAVQQEPRNPQIIRNRDISARSHLELPLRRHHLRVRAADLHAGVQARPIVGLHHLAPVHTVRAHAAIVRSLRAGKAQLRPAQRMVVDVQQRVLLLDAEPRLLGGTHLLGHLGALLALVRLGRCAVVLVRLAQDENVRCAAERITVDGDRMQVDVGVGADRLLGAAAVKVPDGQLLDAVGHLVDGAILAAHILAGSVDPDVRGLDEIVADLQLQVLVQQRLVDARIGRVLERVRHLGRDNR